MQVAVIVNPVAGIGVERSAAMRRIRRAGDLLAAHGPIGEVLPTEGPGHARELALGAVGRGARVVVAWGGDGTVNEVASALAFTAVPLGIVPCGSGNGLARELRLPPTVDAAFAVAVGGGERRIDAGEIEGRLFVNVAGVGFDAAVARAFADGSGGRGFAHYARVTLRELRRYTPSEYTVTTDTGEARVRALTIAVANGRQYGNGATIAPNARLDDGRLDLVVVRARPRWLALAQIPRLFLGGIERASGVGMEIIDEVRIGSATGLACHADGEPFSSRGPILARVRPGALLVRVGTVSQATVSA
jgi:diacylglycerol kinase (ATP)